MEVDRNYNLLPTDIRFSLRVFNIVDGEYDFSYPFQILENWSNLEDIVQETIAVFNQTTVTGVVQFTNNFISPTFELGNYDLTKNDILEPQVVSPPSIIKYYNELGTIEVGKILSNEKTLVIATLEENNLSDFEADPAAPFTYVDNVVDINIKCLEKDDIGGEAFNVGLGVPNSVNQLFKNLKEIIQTYQNPILKRC